MVKKTYIIPEALTVSLNTSSIIAASNPTGSVKINSSESVDAGSVDTKGVSDVNVWDEEW